MSSARKKSKRDKSKPKSQKSSYISWILVALIAIFIAYWNLSYRSIHHDLTRITNVSEWQIMYADSSTSYQFSSSGLEVKTSQDAHIIPPAIIDDTTWEDLPYVTVEFEPENLPRDLNLTWFLTDNEQEFYARLSSIPAKATQTYFNTQDELLTFKIDDWNNTYQNLGRIKKYGLQFKSNFTIKSITLSNHLSLMNHIDLILTNFFITHDRITSYSINFIKGVIVGQSRLILWLGLAVFLTVIYFSIIQKPLRVFTAVLISFMIYDLNFNINLLRLASYGLPLSAFYKSEYDEFSSRFGREFADLNQSLRKLVPEGSKVMFPASIAYPYRGERNWIPSLYAGVYDYVSPKPEYIFVFYPSEGRYGHDQQGRSVLLIGNATYTVENIHFISDSVRIVKIVEAP